MRLEPAMLPQPTLKVQETRAPYWLALREMDLASLSARHFSYFWGGERERERGCVLVAGFSGDGDGDGAAWREGGEERGGEGGEGEVGVLRQGIEMEKEGEDGHTFKSVCRSAAACASVKGNL